MRAAVWITLLTVLIGTLSVEGRSTKRKFLKTPGVFDVKEKQPMEGSNRQARQSTNCIITSRNGRSGRTFKPPPPEESPTCIIIAPPAPVPPSPTTPPVVPPPPVVTPPPVPTPPPPSPTPPPPTPTPPTTTPTTTTAG